ncbi:DUF1653 domain-containing protein [Candidatus Woesearchaeota archaeon]|nr:DUF1653 domain-containing protein [Candidatus Woesearchaeota archaeon]
MDPEPGTYLHFKGKKYEVLGIAKHSETGEELVVYRALHDDSSHGPHDFWVRPRKMFLETVERDGRTMRRFNKVG